MTKWTKNIRVGIFIGLIAVVIYLAFHPAFRPIFTLEYWSAVHRFAVVLRIMKAEHVDADQWNVRDVSETGIQAMLQSVDSYAEWISGDYFEDFIDFKEQRYVGIGVEVTYDHDRLIVISPFEGGPAQLAGVFPGDQILEVDGESMIGKEFKEVIDRLRGREGTSVAIKIYRPATQQELSLVLERRSISVATVTGMEWLQPGIGYLRISRFGDNTDEEFVAALDEMKREGLRGLVIDLRNNPGGILVSCLELIGNFYPKNAPLLRMVSPARKRDVAELNRIAGTVPDYRIAILMDKASASASEIMAAVLQESGIARVFGETSYGKATVQSIIQTGYDEAVRLTTARYLTPGGMDISGNGVVPDVPTGTNAEESARIFLQRRMAPHLARELDHTLQRALEWLEGDAL